MKKMFKKEGGNSIVLSKDDDDNLSEASLDKIIFDAESTPFVECFSGGTTESSKIEDDVCKGLESNNDNKNDISTSCIDQLQEQKDESKVKETNDCASKVQDANGTMNGERQPSKISSQESAEIPEDSEDCDENLFSLRSSNTTIKTFDGLTYDASTLFKNHDMQSIKAQWEKKNNQSGIIEGKRQKIERYVTIDGGEGVGDVKVLKENMYDLEGGEPSIFEKELRGRIKLEDMHEQRKQVQLAGRDYENTDYCQACGEGGDLTCCDHCPMAYHLKCLGYKNEAEFEREVSATTHFWRCPHHYCSKCSRNTSEAGGVLLRCYGCAHAYCEDCLDWKDKNLYICDNQPPLMLKNLGFHICNQGYYIYCSKNCKENGKTQEKLYFEENLLPHEIMEFREMALMIWQLRTSKSNLTS